MAEKTILVCDACGRPAAETVTIKASRGNFVKDMCSTHVSELVAGARKPRPGRRRGVVTQGANTSSGTGAQSATPQKRGAKKTGARKTGAKRRGRPPKKSTA